MLRGLIADYGVPLMVLLWTGVSYIPGNNVPKGLPRRLFSPNPWSRGAYSNWTVVNVNSLRFKSTKCCVKVGTHVYRLSHAGNGGCPSTVHCRRVYTGHHDRSALLLRSQCCVSARAAEGVQPEETGFVPLRPSCFGFPGIYLFIYFSFAALSY